MLAKAHVTVGMAAAFTIMKPETVAEALPVIAGGALGLDNIRPDIIFSGSM